MKNKFERFERYNAAQNISIESLGVGHAPLYYKGLVYIEFNNDSKEHLFMYNGEPKWFDDDFVNNGKSQDNSMLIVESNK